MPEESEKELLTKIQRRKTMSKEQSKETTTDPVTKRLDALIRLLK